MTALAARRPGRVQALGLVLALVTLAVDQVSKLWILGNDVVTSGERLVLTPFMDFVLVWNRGISYGLFQQDETVGRWLLILFSVAAAVALGIWLFRTRRPIVTVAVGLILGGAIGNAIDRLVHGAVVDFVHLHAFGYSWYVFNIADAAIVAGVALLLYDSLLKKGADTPVGS